MEPIFALKWLKLLVSENKFLLVKRKASHASPVTKEMVKLIVNDLSMKDFVKSEKDRDFPNEYVWIYETTFRIKYYIKFKFINMLMIELNWIIKSQLNDCVEIDGIDV